MHNFLLSGMHEFSLISQSQHYKLSEVNSSALSFQEKLRTGKKLEGGISSQVPLPDVKISAAIYSQPLVLLFISC